MKVNILRLYDYSVWRISETFLKDVLYMLGKLLKIHVQLQHGGDWMVLNNHVVDNFPEMTAWAAFKTELSGFLSLVKIQRLSLSKKNMPCISK